ncbi:rod shape-determining protein MreD [Pleionea mediterranea]|uniref:Rod shape-determining protein MreD n=1 Tax=Pleionea mediterranea TaxID=523701 RepID=A0A316FFY3_9GAMM|nr:rod shape-determining protein MreD [Pleionea mediterranea]PWK47818.1 rod shape-determining protein MreD [Pleionea mediterranea]
MNPGIRNNYWVIVLSFAVAMLLDILPLPAFLLPYWPEWVAMTLLYWVVALPQRVGIMTAWVVGLFVDALQGSVLGLHALSLSVMTYFALVLYQRVRLFPRWKQSLVIAMLIGIYMLLALILKSLTVTVEKQFSYWIPMLISGAIWTWIFILLRDIRRQFRVN